VAVHLDLRLVDASDGKPVAGACVRVNEHEFRERFMSDAGGIARIELPEKPEDMAVRVRSRGYVPKLLVWDLRGGRAPWPESFTLQMERAHCIGGVVRNPHGEPVVGAQVLVTLRGPSPAGEPRIHNDLWDRPARTDAEGRWQFPHAPADLAHLRVRLAHPDYVSKIYPIEQPPAEEFQRGTAVLTLTSGTPCEGTVTDEHGQPIAGATVILGEGGSDSYSRDSRRTDARGRFRFGGVAFTNRCEAQILSFQKEGYAPELIELQPSAMTVRGDAVLRRGKALRVRFTDAAGAPVPGVTVAMHGWRSHRPFSCCFRSDESGLAVWESAPQDAAQYSIMPREFQREELMLAPGDEVQTLVLRRPLSIFGSVIDARTRQPVPSFSLIRGGEYTRHGSTIYWNHQHVRKFENGAYRANVGDAVVSRQRDGTVHEQGFRRIRVSAPGYAPAVSRPIANDESEDIRWDVELEPADELTVIVQDAQGQPVAGAAIVIGSGGNPIFIQDGEVHRRREFSYATDSEGRHTLPPQDKDYAVVVAHAQAGYRVTSMGELKNAPEVTLQPWGRVEVLTTARPGERARYHVQAEHLARQEVRPVVRFASAGTMKTEGVLAFEGLPAGEMFLYTSDGTAREPERITIASGQTLRIDRRSGRRAVVGRIALPPQGVGVEEPLARLSLRRGPPGPTRERGSFFEMSFRLETTGQFRIDDVPPGLYQLAGIFFRTPPEGGKPPDFAGYAHKEFELPAGDEAFDLGTIPFQPPDGMRWETRSCRPNGPA
jgi:hypothetical protein